MAGNLKRPSTVVSHLLRLAPPARPLTLICRPTVCLLQCPHANETERGGET